MKLSKYLLAQYPSQVIVVCVLSIISGSTAMYIISYINKTMQSSESVTGSMAIFTYAILVAAYFMIQLLSEYMAIKLSSYGSSRIRKDLSEKINLLPFQKLELIGESELTAALTRDVSVLTSTLTNSPILLSNISIVIGGLIYLLIVSIEIFLLLLGSLVLGVIAFVLVHRYAQCKIHFARQLEGGILEHMQSLIRGAKEIRLNAIQRQKIVHENLYPAVDKQRDENIKAQFASSAAYNIYLTLVFVIIGAILFGTIGVDAAAITSSVIALLFLMGPLNGVVSMYPLYLAGAASFERIDALDTSMNVKESILSEKQFSWDEITLSEVTYRYHTPSETFSLDPLNLSIKLGETVFVVGGNGSGKTTFSKLLTGLYRPASGTISIGNEAITDENLSSYRNCFSAIFSDFYLFADIGVKMDEEKEKIANELLEVFQLKEKVSIVNGKFSEIRLSAGQRKRLALISVIIEDKDIILMDEWAADQDPEFKKTFYDKIIVDLKTAGKTLIIISHDDRFYNKADRLLKFDSGECFDIPVAIDKYAGRTVTLR